MNKKIFTASILLLTFNLAFGENKNLSALMKTSYKSAFYPGVVRYAEEILRSEKNSLAAFRASVYEGESLFRMGRVEDSLSILQKYQLNGDSLNPETIYLNSARFYWIGRCLYSQKNYVQAQSCFYSSAAIYKEGLSLSEKSAESFLDYYALSMLQGGKAYFEEKDYKKAILPYEYVLANGAKYDQIDFEDSALKLAQCYNALGDKESAGRCVKLISQLEEVPFAPDTKYSLIILKGQAYENQKDYKAAYESYCTVIEKAPSYLAAAAMEKAYAVSSAHKKEVGSEPGSVLLNAESRLSEYPDLLSEFWTRLAVDAFNAKDYEKSLAYFKEAEDSASDSQKEISAIYRAEIAYLTSTDKNEGSKKALVILAEVYVTKSGAKNESLLLSLARYNAYLKNWKETYSYASKCLKSENPEILKNAVYWSALAKYEGEEIKAAISTIEAYGKNQKISDKSILTLYAKALAKSGKYHEADLIFYSLGQQNQLDNDGHLDYSRTLLIAGHYVSTKAQAAKASGDEALYLAGLASFNQHKWTEAISSFSKIISSKKLDQEYIAYALFYSGYASYQEGDYLKSLDSLNTFISENPRHKFVWSACMTMARAAAFEKNYDLSVSAALDAIKKSSSDSEKEESIILAAGILSDAKKYDQALELLAPHLTKKSSFGYDCKYRSADILVQKGELSQADKYFADLAGLSDKNARLISEEAAYRRSEIAYSAENYKKAASLFEEYSRKWPDGRFTYGAIYFSADSLAKSGDTTLAILRYQQITDSQAETSYRYGSEKNLVDLYIQTKEFDSAMAMAQRMIDEYGSQALNDGMDKKIKEIKEKNVWNANSEDDLIARAEKDLEKQKNNPEKSADALKNALYLADRYRSLGQNKKSALMYLDSVKYARQSGNDEKAARSFYGAVEAFDAAGMYADAKASYEEMKKLYPENKYTKDGEKIAGQL
ncbi:MAG: tetratricopeptide repeat protein [Treponema sp.]|nr:tetratricopeptide repeat protein [Treponema sp.]